MLEGNLSIHGDRFWLEQANAASGEAWRWGTEDDDFYLQRRREGHSPTLLTKVSVPDAVSDTNRFKVIKRGAGIWIEWNNKPVFPHPVLWMSTWTSPLRLVVWKENGEASITLHQPSFAQYPFVVRPMDGMPSASEIQQLVQVAGKISAISPAQFVWDGNTLQERPIDRELITMLSYRYGWINIPTLEITSPMDPVDVSSILRRTGMSKAPDGSGYLASLGGIRVDLSRLSMSEQVPWLEYFKTMLPDAEVNQQFMKEMATLPGFDDKRLLISTINTRTISFFR